MCGIVGYIGSNNAVPVLLDGLRRLEYRGYDSAGMAILNGNGIELRKRVGRIANLAELLKESPTEGEIGISHTRWATHGGVSDDNAHPHFDQSGNIALVHNGDRIRLSVKARSLDLLVDESVLAQRRGTMRVAPPPRRGYAQLYMNSVLQAEHGCDFDFLRFSPLPRP